MDLISWSRFSCIAQCLRFTLNEACRPSYPLRWSKGRKCIYLNKTEEAQWSIGIENKYKSRSGFFLRNKNRRSSTSQKRLTNRRSFYPLPLRCIPQQRIKFIISLQTTLHAEKSQHATLQNTIKNQPAVFLYCTVCVVLSLTQILFSTIVRVG